MSPGKDGVRDSKIVGGEGIAGQGARLRHINTLHPDTRLGRRRGRVQGNGDEDGRDGRQVEIKGKRGRRRGHRHNGDRGSGDGCGGEPGKGAGRLFPKQADHRIDVRTWPLCGCACFDCDARARGRVEPEGRISSRVRARRPRLDHAPEPGGQFRVRLAGHRPPGNVADCGHAGAGVRVLQTAGVGDGALGLLCPEHVPGE